MQNDTAEIRYAYKNRIAVKQHLQMLRQNIYAVKNSRAVHNNLGKYAVKVLDIPKEYI